MLRINTNVSAFNTLRAMSANATGMSRSLERLSSGLRVNRASDDAAGLSISENLLAQVRGGQQAARNLQDGISLVNVAEGALNEIHDILQRMNTLAVQASNGTNTTEDRAALQAEFVALQAEIGNIATNTTFNGTRLFTGLAGAYTSGTFTTTAGTNTNVGTTAFNLTGPASPLSPSSLDSLTVSVLSTGYPGSPGPPVVAPIFPVLTTLAPSDYTVTANPQGFNGTTPLYSYTVTVNNSAVAGTGPWTFTATAGMTYPTTTLPMPIEIQAGASQGQTETISIPPVNTGAIGVGNAALTSQPAAMAAIQSVQQAIGTVSTIRSGLGASANRLSHAAAAVQIAVEDQLAAYSRIRDADMASHMTDLTRQQILMRSSTSMLSIANDYRYLDTLLGG
ncbi:MAG: flagellin [Candidatus Sericytochromatia bacterium]